MKQLILHLIVFFALMLTLDSVVGYACNYMSTHTIGGDSGQANYIANDIADEVVIMGSSRAMHHYDPRIIEDSLGMTCYNASYDGYGIILMYGRYKLMTRHYHPKVIIYDVCTSYDLLEGDNHRDLSRLRPYYDEVGVDSIFWMVDKSERYKMLSQCYRNNSAFTRILAEWIHPTRSDIKGFRPMDAVMNYEPIIENQRSYRYDDLKQYYLQKLIVECKQNGTQLVFATSPQYKMESNVVYLPMQKLCSKYHIPFIEHYTDSAFVYNKAYFYDSSHMNQTGATAYTQLMVHELKDIIY